MFGISAPSYFLALQHALCSFGVFHAPVLEPKNQLFLHILVLFTREWVILKFKIWWMDKEDVVHIYNGILLSHKKEQNWVTCRNMESPRVCHIEWSKPAKEKIVHINASVWILEKWYRWTYLQGRNRDADIRNGYVDMGGHDELGG